MLAIRSDAPQCWSCGIIKPLAAAAAKLSGLDTTSEMAKVSLRNASIFCLAMWAAIWCVFVLLRFSTFDIRDVPGIGAIMLTALAVVFLAPFVAAGLSAAAVFVRPREVLNWLALGCAVAILFGQALLFLVSGWQ